MSDETEPDEEMGTTGRGLGPMFTAGGRPGPGRPRGAANRTTYAMRAAIAAVFQDLQDNHEGKGEYPHFYAWAVQHPTEVYRIAARQMPMQVETTGRTIGMIVFKGLNDKP